MRFTMYALALCLLFSAHGALGSESNSSLEVRGSRIRPNPLWWGYRGSGADFPPFDLPTTLREAYAGGWSRTANTPFGVPKGFLGHETFPRIFLYYDKSDTFQKILFEAEPSFRHVNLHREWVFDTGVEGKLGSLFTFPRDRNGPVLWNKMRVELPQTVQQAQAAGWTRGACFRFMGGTHYFYLPDQHNKAVKNKFDTMLPVNPIYDLYGSGKLMAVTTTYRGPTEEDQPSYFGFDAQGQPLPQACEFNMCSYSHYPGAPDPNGDCARATVADAGTTSAHVFYFDRLNPQEVPRCQLPGFRVDQAGGIDGYSCESDIYGYLPCSCCGPPEFAQTSRVSRCPEFFKH